LEAQDVEFAWCDTDAYRDTFDLSFAVENGVACVTFRIGGIEYEGRAIAAVLFRHVRAPQASQIVDPEARRMVESELGAALEGGLAALEPKVWMNHPQANRLARSKLLQLRLATYLGFKVPETLVSSDPQEIKRRYDAWNGSMVAKLVGGQIVGATVDSQYAIYTTLITEEDLRDTDALSVCPAVYQRHVDKRYDLRVTVVGDEAFSCRIRSQEIESSRVDWRAGGSTPVVEPCEVHPSIADRCRSLMRALGLEIAGIDFIVTPEGDTVFLEINAAGRWAWVEEATGLPIAAAVAGRLAAATRTFVD